jgi:uncharacterized membrane protein
MNNETRKEIHQEFQVERMILFSDAVFAIVITLMAIEMHIPDRPDRYTGELFLQAVIHLIPVIIAYVATFMFIGVIWYQHLKLFSAVKAFDRGLVVRNLLLLFFIGLFPFSASIIAKVNTAETMAPMLIYFSIILSCMLAQVNLQHYILYTKPELRNSMDVSKLELDYKRKRGGVFAFLGVLAVYVILSVVLAGTDYIYFAPMSFILTPVFMKLFGAYKKSIATSEN